MAMIGWRSKKKIDGGTVAQDASFRRADHVVSASEGARTVLLDPVGGAYFGLNEVGARIWELLPGHPTPAALAARLGDEFDAPPATLSADAARLLGELATLKLVARG